jgi:hypothetical protein
MRQVCCHITLKPMSDYYAQFDAAGKAFDENTLATCDDATLQRHLVALANEPVPNTAVQHRNIIRGITINHLLLQRHIDRLNHQNSITQRLVIALTVAALMIGIPQLWLAYKADKRAETEQTPNTATSSKNISHTSAPSQDQFQPKSPAQSAAETVSSTSTKH